MTILVKSPKKAKVPKPLPIWLVKASWDATAVYLKVPARSEIQAKDNAWKKVSKTEGGDMCKQVTVLGLSNELTWKA